MKAFIIGLLSFGAVAQTTSTVGIQPNPCAQVQGSNNFALDFGGLCKYESANLQLPAPSEKRVVYFGDSITEFWRQGMPGISGGEVINRGYSGQTTAQMVVRFRADVIKLKPRIVHLMAGTNDIAGNTGPTTLERIQDNFRTMCEMATRHGIRVVIGSVLPARSFSWRAGIAPAANIRALNTWLKSYALKNGHTYADYHAALSEQDGGLSPRHAPDGVHPNSAGYAVMQGIAMDALLQADRL